MEILLIILLLLVVGAAVFGPVIWVYSRRQAREQKNFERGLKMVPLLIHLPPISEDTESNGRDIRDLVDENISKAQIVYNIIASTYEKGFKRKLYGQQHFAFEIVSAQGFVYFYTSVPIKLVEVVRQAIVSAYPAARLEEAEEHNIFNVSGKVSGTTGGELVLKEAFAYPISTYVDLKRDAMQALLNSLSTVGKEDGAAIQILMRPADPGWRKTAHSLAESRRKGEKDNTTAKAALGLFKEVGTALVKPPEANDKGGSDKKELSEHEQAILNAIDDKTRYPAYEVLIRVVASSNVSQKSQTILNNMVAAFSLFDAPGKNGFKYEPAKDIDELVTSYIMKFFPQEKNKMILNSVELATIFHFPDQRSIPTSQLERQDSKQVDGPRNMPEDGLLLGYNLFRGVKKPIRLSLGDRQRHMYVVGQTGTGKSTFLENLALQDMMTGGGFAFVDPHGDTAEKLLSMVPKERTEDVIYFCPADMDYPMGLNLFEYDNPDQKDFLIQEALNMLQKLYDPNHQGIMGPRYEHLFRNAALTVMADPAGGTFIDIPKLFRDPQYVKQKLQYVKDMNVLEFWQKEMPQSQRSNEFGEVVSWFVSKFGAFLSNEMMRNIIGQTESAFKLRDIMDNKKILLVNLSKGRTGDLNSKLLGMVFVMKFQAAAMSRANIPESQRVDFALYVDEFQNFSTDSFATIMSEARKYRLNLIVANQFTTQLTEEIRDAVFGNMGTIVSFRIGQNDVEALSRYFQPTFDGDDLLRVPNYNTIVRTLVGGVPTQPFSMATLPAPGTPNPKLGEALKQLSAAKYGRPKAAVEKEIFERIATKEAPGAAMGPGGARPFGGSPWQPGGAASGGFSAGAGGFGAGAPRPAAPGYPAGAYGAGGPTPTSYAPPAPRAGTGSFLDEWLAKRGAPGAAAHPGTYAASAPAPSQPKPFDNRPAQPPVNQPAPALRQEAPLHNEPKATPPPVSHAPTPNTVFRPANENAPAPSPVAPAPSVAEEVPLHKEHHESIFERVKPGHHHKDEHEDRPMETEAAEETGDKPRKKKKRRKNKHRAHDPAELGNEGPQAGEIIAPNDPRLVRHEIKGKARELANYLDSNRTEPVEVPAVAAHTEHPKHEPRPEPTEAPVPDLKGGDVSYVSRERQSPQRLDRSGMTAAQRGLSDSGASSQAVGAEEPPADLENLTLEQLRKASPSGGDLDHGDTIYIDKEGNLKVIKEGEQPSADQPAKNTTAPSQNRPQ